ncbi:hypothetical protein C0J52_26813, partial [Blattella germanica]
NAIDSDNTFAERIVFSDEATFHVSGKVNKHNVRIWGLQNPHKHIEHVRDSPKVNVFCAISHSSVYGPFFFDGDTVNGQQYLAMLQNWLFPRLHGFVKDKVYVPPLTQNLEELKNRILTAIRSVTMDMLIRVWQEFEYRCDIVRVAGGGHIEHL